MSDLCYNCGACHLPARCKEAASKCSICSQKGHMKNFCHRGYSQKNPDYKFLGLCHNCSVYHLPEPCAREESPCPGCGENGHQQYYCHLNATQRPVALAPGYHLVSQNDLNAAKEDTARWVLDLVAQGLKKNDILQKVYYSYAMLDTKPHWRSRWNDLKRGHDDAVRPGDPTDWMYAKEQNGYQHVIGPAAEAGNINAAKPPRKKRKTKAEQIQAFQKQTQKMQSRPGQPLAPLPPASIPTHADDTAYHHVPAGMISQPVPWYTFDELASVETQAAAQAPQTSAPQSSVPGATAPPTAVNAPAAPAPSHNQRGKLCLPGPPPPTRTVEPAHTPQASAPPSSVSGATTAPTAVNVPAALASSHHQRGKLCLPGPPTPARIVDPESLTIDPALLSSGTQSPSSHTASASPQPEAATASVQTQLARAHPVYQPAMLHVQVQNHHIAAPMQLQQPTARGLQIEQLRRAQQAQQTHRLQQIQRIQQARQQSPVRQPQRPRPSPAQVNRGGAIAASKSRRSVDPAQTAQSRATSTAHPEIISLLDDEPVQSPEPSRPAGVAQPEGPAESAQPAEHENSADPSELAEPDDDEADRLLEASLFEELSKEEEDAARELGFGNALERAGWTPAWT